MQENKLGVVGYNAIFNRIPGFVGNEKAAELLSETEEFKKASKFFSFSLSFIQTSTD